MLLGASAPPQASGTMWSTTCPGQPLGCPVCRSNWLFAASLRLIRPWLSREMPLPALGGVLRIRGARGAYDRGDGLLRILGLADLGPEYDRRGLDERGWYDRPGLYERGWYDRALPPPLRPRPPRQQVEASAGRAPAARSSAPSAARHR